MCKNHCDSTERVFKRIVLEFLWESTGPGACPKSACRGLTVRTITAMDPMNGWRCELLSYVSDSLFKVWSAQEPSMFPLCFQKAWQRPQDVVLFTSCHLHTLSLKAESPLWDQRAVKWSWKKDLSTPSPELSLEQQSAACCQIYSFMCEHGHKNQQK